MGLGWYNDSSSIAFSNINGPISLTNAERISSQKVDGQRVGRMGGSIVPVNMPGNVGNLLTLPVILALGALVWYAIKTYE